MVVGEGEWRRGMTSLYNYAFKNSPTDMIAWKPVCAL